MKSEFKRFRSFNYPDLSSLWAIQAIRLATLFSWQATPFCYHSLRSRLATPSWRSNYPFLHCFVFVKALQAVVHDQTSKVSVLLLPYNFLPESVGLTRSKVVENVCTKKDVGHATLLNTLARISAVSG